MPMNIKFITIIITLEGIEKKKTEKKTEKNNNNNQARMVGQLQWRNEILDMRGIVNKNLK